ncbi:hypothetical protein QBC43DRAFT_28319 [Cladorrhinum sp. PSN259]|nr:hypothetical protein QBC43DRAFT_28319 [Cladorrhinum sp. PSN259]
MGMALLKIGLLSQGLAVSSKQLMHGHQSNANEHAHCFFEVTGGIARRWMICSNNRQDAGKLRGRLSKVDVEEEEKDPRTRGRGFILSWKTLNLDEGGRPEGADDHERFIISLQCTAKFLQVEGVVAGQI